MAALIKHPNAGGVLVLGLGCENNQISALKKVMGTLDDDRIQFLVSQEVEDEVETGLAMVMDLAEKNKTGCAYRLAPVQTKNWFKMWW